MGTPGTAYNPYDRGSVLLQAMSIYVVPVLAILNFFSVVALLRLTHMLMLIFISRLLRADCGPVERFVAGVAAHEREIFVLRHRRRG